MKIFGTAAVLVVATVCLTLTGETLLVYKSMLLGGPIPWSNGDSGMILLEALLVAGILLLLVATRQLWALNRLVGAGNRKALES